MPPSPALRCSPARELRGEKHRRRHSIENGSPFKEKDDDLALFNEMQSREMESFLLHPSDDFEDPLSRKLKNFSDFTVPSRGESSELLNVDGDKNDYDWLLTPPDTPLFRSLDDEPPQLTAGDRGRPRSQPITLSRSSTMEKSHRSSRGSPSPNRLSSSPRSVGSSANQLRGRPSSARQSSPSPSQRPSTPVRRPSPPPSKPSTPVSRSLTPTSRRLSTGSGKTSPGIRGSSPVGMNRGNSASPKIKAWQSNIPGFSLEAPPNLRTSLADRPASYVRGSSPASRNGPDSASRINRPLLSSTASRSVGSSNSHDRDRLSPHSKGSVASSGDDDLDSFQSFPRGGSDSSVSKRTSPFSNNKAPRSLRLTSPSSAPKRSFDSALRQMDNRKNHQNMFRPLMSSVPSTSLYTGKESTSYDHIISRHSSITSSSNAGSDHGPSLLLDTGSSDSVQANLSETEKLLYPDVQEPVFAFDNAGTVNEGNKHDNHRDDNQDHVNRFNQGASEEFRHQIDEDMGLPSDNMYVDGDISYADDLEDTTVCSRCGCHYRVEHMEGESTLCPDCMEQLDDVSISVPETAAVVDDSPEDFVKMPEERKFTNEMTTTYVTRLLPASHDTVEVGSIQKEDNIKQEESYYSLQGQDFLQENTIKIYQREIEQLPTDHTLLDRDSEDQAIVKTSDHQELKVGISGGGITRLFNRSNSCKGPIGQAKNTSIKSYEDFSYARESTNSLRSSTGHNSSSLSSSADHGSSRHKGNCMQRQLSSKMIDLDNHGHSMSSKSQSSMPSLSEVSSIPHQTLGVAIVLPENSIEESSANVSCDTEKTPQASQTEIEILETNEDIVTNASLTDETALGENATSIDISALNLYNNAVVIESEDNPSLQNNETCVSHENGKDLQNHSDDNLELKVECSDEEELTMLKTGVNGEDDIGDPDFNSSMIISEVEAEISRDEMSGSQVDVESPESKSNIIEFQETHYLSSSDKDVETSIVVPNSSDHALEIIDESTVVVKCNEGTESRSLTLEEATDTILFCRSIVHDLAYQAASIAIEKSNKAEFEALRPSVTILGKSNAENPDFHGRTKPKRSTNAVKARQRQAEKPVVKDPMETENDENAGESLIRNVGIPDNKRDSLNPPKLESKCNCTIM